MPSWDVEINDFQIVCGVIGVFTTALALLSHLIKERIFISEACKLDESLTKCALGMTESQLTTNSTSCSTRPFGRRGCIVWRKLHPASGLRP